MIDSRRQNLLHMRTQMTSRLHNWSSTKKTVIILIVLNTVPQRHHQLRPPKRKCSRHHFRLANPSSAQLALLKSIYLLGYIFGPLVFRTLSEIYGRRTILLPTFFCFTAFTLGCALVPN
ncbi:hypothetical protein F5882DRAFT_418703 [Hyaloscypha sp. PMI_1271]|nr:hypothetical protein F5882DRAFT_418703 [Hyaloscypha sp. PMI_1271]